MAIEQLENEEYSLDDSLSEITDATEIDFSGSEETIESGMNKLDINKLLGPTQELLNKINKKRKDRLSNVLTIENHDKPQTENTRPPFLNLVPNGGGFSLEYSRRYLTPYYKEVYGKKKYKSGIATFTLSYNKHSNSIFVMSDIGGKIKETTISELTPELITAIRNISGTIDDEQDRLEQNNIASTQ